MYHLPTWCQVLSRRIGILLVMPESNYFDLYFVEGKSDIAENNAQSLLRETHAFIDGGFARSVGWYKNTLSRKKQERLVCLRLLLSDTCLWKRTSFVSLYLK